MSVGAPAVGVLGALTDLALNRDRRSFTIHVELPFDAWDRVTNGIGLPISPHADEDAVSPAVAVLSCRNPVHPLRENDVVADAAFKLLAHLLHEGIFVLPETKRNFDRAWSGHRRREGNFPFARWIKGRLTWPTTS